MGAARCGTLAMTARARQVAALATLIGALGCLGGLLIDPPAMRLSYLVAFVAVSAAPIGALAVLMVSYLVRGDWAEGLRVPLTAAALSLPVVALLFVPIVVALPWLYPWSAGAERHGALQEVYLTPWFFVVRAIGYFAIWILLALWMRATWNNPSRM